MSRSAELAISTVIVCFIILFILCYDPVSENVNKVEPNTTLTDKRMVLKTEKPFIITVEKSKKNHKKDPNYKDFSPLVSPSPTIYKPLSSRGSSLAARVVQTSYKYIGVPYVWGGSTPGGFDCSGFVQWVYTQNGVFISRTADVQYTEGIPVSRPAPGDLVFFTTYAPGASHVGIYLANSKFIHASSSGQVMISSLEDDFYRSVYIGARRFFN
ncbi:MAG TPA: C40 family peptidase [Candidatus Eremiobacteraeota bacterium]|nr:MAG: D-gamma-glutamyl-meso-diaminopimelic acid endopeptidase CwlS precursor [bacterium ADurb.Bin363]HPZ08556.1 C40 family peptidase [Candidatus Eremiobacteraeota bacterium]